MADKSSNKLTAATAKRLLCERDPTFRLVRPGQKKRIVIEFAKSGCVVYGQAFDLVRCDPLVDLDDPEAIARALPSLQLYELKSSNRNLLPGFADYFFSFSTAELLVAQSIGERFRFVFVNIFSGEILDISLREVFAKARAIYPSWSVKF